MYNVSASTIHLSNLQINFIISSISSLLFFTGWWILADIEVYRVSEGNKFYYVPAVVGTIAFVFTNIVPAHFFYDSFTYQQNCFTPSVARVYLFVWLMISFGSLIGAFYVLVNEFILRPERVQWPGYGICLQNTFIFVSSMLLSACINWVVSLIRLMTMYGPSQLGDNLGYFPLVVDVVDPFDHCVCMDPPNLGDFSFFLCRGLYSHGRG